MARVVIVDDDFDMINVFSQYLQIKGIEVVGKGYNGKEGVELYQELKPDVIITDMRMPEFDGNFAIENIKSEDPDAKIFVVTGSAEDYNNLEEKVTAVFRKPYEINEIVKAILDIAKVPAS